MGYVNVNVDVDIDEIIDNLTKTDIKEILQDITNRELLDECKRREMSTVRSVEINKWLLESNYSKRSYLIKILDLPSFANDAEILKAVQENI